MQTTLISLWHLPLPNRASLTKVLDHATFAEVKVFAKKHNLQGRRDLRNLAGGWYVNADGESYLLDLAGCSKTHVG